MHYFCLNTVACIPVARQRPRNKLDNGRYYAMARKQKQWKGVFCAVCAEMLVAGQLVSQCALRVVESDEKGTQCQRI
jgi:hypothetical protein